MHDLDTSFDQEIEGFLMSAKPTIQNIILIIMDFNIDIDEIQLCLSRMWS